jgi:HD-like signal output (HDOD) protein
LRGLLANETLKGIVSRAGDLPALPATYSALMKELQSEDASIGTIGKIIESDMGMTAKILQMVNSAFFGLGREVTGATQAVSLLGLETVKALVLVVGVFSQADEKKFPGNVSLDALCGHCLEVGSYARAICRHEKVDKNLAENAYTAGLLHDVGTLLLMTNFTDDYSHVLDSAIVNHTPLVQAELENFRCTHAEMGAYLLGIWGLSDPLVEAAAFHHTPGQCPADSFSPLTAVHVANVFEREAHGAGGAWGVPELDMEYLGKLGLSEKVEEWRDACLSLDQRKG